MQWKNVRLIYVREMRDQLRDRRTLFLIAVLPLLLYPLLGMSFFQLSQFLRDHAARVLVIGAQELPPLEWLPPLLEDGRFSASLFDSESQQRKLSAVAVEEWAREAPSIAQGIEWNDDATWEDAARRLVDGGRFDVVLRFPGNFGSRLGEVRQSVLDRRGDSHPPLPEPVILYNSANEQSQVAQLRVEQVLRHWRSKVTQRNLVDSNVPLEATEPFVLKPRDVAEVQQRQAAIWSKILPFVVFIWALTGAFYPAVDLCAGEKERGTLETLLTSPALRREIVWGKLLTIMTFSSITALLNLASLGMTGTFVMERLNDVAGLGDRLPLSMPPVASLGWLAVALLPVSALFGALCLACAAFARSTKEGQYYLMPLMLVIMPLMLLPMSPGVELTLGNSLIPVTGLVLLLRAMIEGQYWAAAPFAIPAVGMTLICCLLAIRWAEEQFNRESVLFRESERLQLGRWMLHLVRDRAETPSLAQAALCVALILVVQFFISVALSARGAEGLDFWFLTQSLFISQIVCIFVPAALMTLMLTRNPARTLLLDRLPAMHHAAAAVALALLLHPVVVRFGKLIEAVYPMSPEVASSAQAIQETLLQAPSWWMPLALMALLPAVCEEIAFRGFILSGFRRVGHKWWAIGLSAVAFGGVHMFLQQRISAAAVGMVLGYLAIQSGSLVPCMLFHAVHNGLQLTVFRLAHAWEQAPAGEAPAGPWARLLLGDQPVLYSPPCVAVCGAAAAGILWALHFAAYSRTREEALQEARERQASGLAGA